LIQIQREFNYEEVISAEDKRKCQPATGCHLLRQHAIRRRIEELTRSWVGIAEISFDLPANLDEFGEDANMVCQLIEEGVINAIRHGKAKKIKIHGFFIPGSINVVIHDNGTYVKNKKSDGLGSVLFNTFAKDWDIRPEQNGTTLRFSVETFSNTVDK
jgi:two-component sensor histidine kinase